MRIPKVLKGEAKSFWKFHASRCIEEGLLTEATLHTFIILCRTWALIADMEPQANPDPKDKRLMGWNGLVKTYDKYALQFGITSKKPAAKKQDLQKIISEGLRNAEKDE